MTRTHQIYQILVKKTSPTVLNLHSFQWSIYLGHFYTFTLINFCLNCFINCQLISILYVQMTTKCRIIWAFWIWTLTIFVISADIFKHVSVTVHHDWTCSSGTAATGIDLHDRNVLMVKLKLIFLLSPCTESAMWNFYRAIFPFMGWAQG